MCLFRPRILAYNFFACIFHRQSQTYIYTYHAKSRLNNSECVARFARPIILTLHILCITFFLLPFLVTLLDSFLHITCQQVPHSRFPQRLPHFNYKVPNAHTPSFFLQTQVLLPLKPGILQSYCYPHDF